MDDFKKTYKEINKNFFHALDDILKLKKIKTWEDLTKKITPQNIIEISNAYLTLYNIDTFYYHDTSQEKKDKLSLLYSDNINCYDTIPNITRQSLYADEIITFHPLQLIKRKIETSQSPILRPDLWANYFFISIYYYISLKKWMENDIVHIIENPIPLKIKKQRSKNYTVAIVDKKTGKVSSKSTIKDVKKIEELFDMQLRETISIPCGNLEQFSQLTNITNSHFYTVERNFDEYPWRNYVKQIDLSSFWTKFGKMYSGMPILFPNNIHTSFILQLKKENRLEIAQNGFKQFFSILNDMDFYALNENNIEKFNETFYVHFKETEREWNSIINETKENIIKTIIGTGAMTWITDYTKILPITFFSGLLILQEKISEKRKLNELKQSKPFAMFIELKNGNPNIINEFRNCIF